MDNQLQTIKKRNIEINSWIPEYDNAVEEDKLQILNRITVKDLHPNINFFQFNEIQMNLTLIYYKSRLDHDLFDNKCKLINDDTIYNYNRSDLDKKAFKASYQTRSAFKTKQRIYYFRIDKVMVNGEWINIHDIKPQTTICNHPKKNFIKLILKM